MHGHVNVPAKIHLERDVPHCRNHKLHSVAASWLPALLVVLTYYAMMPTPSLFACSSLITPTWATRFALSPTQRHFSGGACAYTAVVASKIACINLICIDFIIRLLLAKRSKAGPKLKQGILVHILCNDSKFIFAYSLPVHLPTGQSSAAK
jgi:hypothetical protein